MIIDLVQALTTGGAVAGALKGLSALESFFGRRNGNGTGKFSQSDHDTLRDVERGVALLHEDLVELRQDMRDCLNGKRY